MALNVDKISFTGHHSKDKKVGVTDAGLAAGGAIGSWQYIRRFDKFNLGKRIDDYVTLSNESAKVCNLTANTMSNGSALFKNFKSNFAHYKDLFLTWSKSTKLGQIIKPVIESKAYRGVAGLFGGIAATFVFISGVGEMGQAIAKYTNK